jgi:outer membrane protein assembly factor BamB
VDDACKFITESPLPTDAGLVPDSRDVHLAVSWPQTIRNALHDEPRLVAAMQSGFGRLGELRLSRAVAEGDAEAVHTASVQFLGTQIVAEAYLELGDRDLALGRFTQALARFQAGLRDASPEQADRLEQRKRLAASFIGMEIGPPARASVSLNDKNLTAEQFESLLEALRRRATVGKLLPTDQLTAQSATGLPPGRYILQPVASWELGPSPQDRERKIASDHVHLAALGTESIYVTGGLGTIAIALREQSIRWSHPRGLDQPARPNLERMASAGDRLFWSRPTAGGLELTCLDPISGAVRWHKLHSDLPVISDPVWSQRQLFVVTAHSPAQGARRIALCELNPQNGDTVLQTDIGGLVAEEAVEPNCILAAIDDRLILAAAGGVLCCDREGRVHWRQRSTWLPAEIRSLASDANVAMALVVQPHAPLVVLQPGAPGLQAFDLETGRRGWQRAIPDLKRIVGSVAGRIVAQTPRGLLAFQAADGAFEWQRDLPASPCTCGVCDDGQVVTGSVEVHENGKQQLVLQWLAGRDGRDETSTSVEIPDPHVNSVTCFGSIAGHFFVVGYDMEKSAARLLEFVPAGSATDKP